VFDPGCRVAQPKGGAAHHGLLGRSGSVRAGDVHTLPPGLARDLTCHPFPHQCKAGLFMPLQL